MIDRKITNKELSEKGLTVDGVEILPPVNIITLSQLRAKRQIPYTKIFGKIYYQVSDLKDWCQSKKVEAVN